jgi:hypothetical protein
MLDGLSLDSHTRRNQHMSSLMRAASTTPAPQSRLDRVRGAGAAFLRGTTVGWDRRELADWLVCQYAPCAATPLDAESTELPPACERTLDEGILERVILDARGGALRLFADLVVRNGDLAARRTWWHRVLAGRTPAHATLRARRVALHRGLPQSPDRLSLGDDVPRVRRALVRRRAGARLVVQGTVQRVDGVLGRRSRRCCREILTISRQA